MIIAIVCIIRQGHRGAVYRDLFGTCFNRHIAPTVQVLTGENEIVIYENRVVSGVLCFDAPLYGSAKFIFTFVFAFKFFLSGGNFPVRIFSAAVFGCPRADGKTDNPRVIGRSSAVALKRLAVSPRERASLVRLDINGPFVIGIQFDGIGDFRFKLGRLLRIEFRVAILRVLCCDGLKNSRFADIRSGRFPQIIRSVFFRKFLILRQLEKFDFGKAVIRGVRCRLAETGFRHGISDIHLNRLKLAFAVFGFGNFRDLNETPIDGPLLAVTTKRPNSGITVFAYAALKGQSAARFFDIAIKRV
jgi:hypothetical protein